VLLARGDKVINFDLSRRRGPLAWLMRDVEQEIVYEKGDVANLTQLIAVLQKHRPNKIAHLAASVDMESLETYPKQVFDQMVGGTVNVLEGMRLLGGVERLVNFSSIGVLPTKQYEPMDCNHPTLLATQGPSSGIYGSGKVAGEAFCWAYAELFNLDIVQVRPSAAYGFFTANFLLMNDMLEGALRGEAVSLPHGRNIPRDYTHVHDIAGIAAAALNVPSSRLQHRVFYAASGMNPLVTGGQIADIVGDGARGQHRNRRNHYTAHGALLCGIPRRAGCQPCRGAAWVPHSIPRYPQWHERVCRPLLRVSRVSGSCSRQTG